MKAFSARSGQSVYELFTCVNNIGFIREASFEVFARYGCIVDETESCCLCKQLVGVLEIDDTATDWLIVEPRGFCDDFFLSSCLPNVARKPGCA